ncbi:MAG: hypothetical protein IT463_10575, partial [Planctomycetes bacterium]|nr:hypothetical protein [Planctomycetota bacterium]
TGAQLLVLPGHEKAIVRVNLSPDERLAASASLDSSSRLWPVSLLNEPVDRLLSSSRLRAGLRIEGFGSFAEAEWPPAGQDQTELLAARGLQAVALRRHLLDWQETTEPWRCVEERGADGLMRRRYLPVRGKDPRTGEFAGAPKGRVDVQGMLEARAIPQQDVLPVLTVDAGGAGELAGLKPGDILWAIDGERVESREKLREIVARQQPMRWTVRRYARNEAGQPQPLRDGQGLILDADGRPQWQFEEFTREFSPGKIGVRLDEAKLLRNPSR